MTQREAFSYVKKKILNKVVCSQTEENVNSQQLVSSQNSQPRRVIQYGSGQPVLKPLTGLETIAMASIDLSPERLINDVKNVLEKYGYTSNTQFDAKNAPILKGILLNELMPKYKEYFKVINPEYLPKEVKPYL